jgi:hypothetical protein
VVLDLLPQTVAICRLAPSAAVPEWTRDAHTFLAVVRTPGELSVVADSPAVPPEQDGERDYRLLRVRGPLSLNMVGIFAAIAVPLAAAGVATFPMATFDTDYVMIRSADELLAVRALRAAGHVVETARSE